MHLDGSPKQPAAVVLFAHGSRDPLWKAPMEAVRDEITQRAKSISVRCAYLELCEPSLPEVVQELHANGVEQLKIVPMFLGTGRHAREDLPALVTTLSEAYPGIRITVQQAIGEDPRMTRLMAEIAMES